MSTFSTAFGGEVLVAGVGGEFMAKLGRGAPPPPLQVAAGRSLRAQRRAPDPPGALGGVGLAHEPGDPLGRSCSLEGCQMLWVRP